VRFVIAIVLFVVAFVAIGFGIAQRTILAGPASYSTEISTGDAPITVVDGDALNALQGTQTVSIDGQGDIFLAYGRTTDVVAWIDDLAYNHVTFDRTTLQLTTETVSGEGASGEGETAAPTAPAADPAATPDPTATDEVEAGDVIPFSGDVPDPRDSDLWMQEFDGTNELVRKINAPQDISLIIMSNGVDAAPSDLKFTWPLDNSAPLSGPLIIGGILSLLAGLAAFLWALVHARRRRGPRRKQPRLPKAPQPKRLKRAKDRKAITAGRASLVAASLAASLVLSGCTVGGGVLGSGLASPNPTSTDIGDISNLKPVAVTKQQLGRIIDKLADTVDEADAGKSADLAATRLAGPALAMRTANYTITTADPSLAAVPAFPDGDVEVVLPQQNDAWPRSVFAVVQPTDTNAAPVAMMLVQDSPRDNYKVHYLITLEPGLVVPPVAPAEIGSVQLNSDNGLGLLRPDQLAASYGAVLIQGEAAPDFALFDAESDTLRVDIGYDAKQQRKADLPETASIEFVNAEGAEPSISFPTNDSGQIVAVLLDDSETVTPLEAGAAINTPAAVKALSGLARTAKGITATYGVQLLFYVPPVSDTSAKIQLLGFSQGLVKATEVGS
jgi:hypothetical protein